MAISTVAVPFTGIVSIDGSIHSSVTSSTSKSPSFKVALMGVPLVSDKSEALICTGDEPFPMLWKVILAMVPFPVQDGEGAREATS